MKVDRIFHRCTDIKSRLFLTVLKCRPRLVHFEYFWLVAWAETMRPIKNIQNGPNADYWLADYPELTRSTQPTTMGGPLGEPGFCIFCSTDRVHVVSQTTHLLLRSGSPRGYPAYWLWNSLLCFFFIAWMTISVGLQSVYADPSKIHRRSITMSCIRASQSRPIICKAPNANRQRRWEVIQHADRQPPWTASLPVAKKRSYLINCTLSITHEVVNPKKNTHLIIHTNLVHFQMVYR